MAHALGLSVVAEGVETEDQLEELRVIGCRLRPGLPARAARRGRSPGDPGRHARARPLTRPRQPHQSRTSSASVCAVVTIDGRCTRSSTEWMFSACGPKQIAGVAPWRWNVRASVVAVEAKGAGATPVTARRGRADRIDHRVGLEDVALAGEAVVADLDRAPLQERVGARGLGDGRLDAGAQVLDPLAGESASRISATHSPATVDGQSPPRIVPTFRLIGCACAENGAGAARR